MSPSEIAVLQQRVDDQAASNAKTAKELRVVCEENDALREALRRFEHGSVKALEALGWNKGVSLSDEAASALDGARTHAQQVFGVFPASPSAISAPSAVNTSPKGGA